MCPRCARPTTRRGRFGPPRGGPRTASAVGQQRPSGPGDPRLHRLRGSPSPGPPGGSPRSARVSASRIAPPPRATTACFLERLRHFDAFDGRGSVPRRTRLNSCGIGPCSSTIRRSVSTKAPCSSRATRLPDPGLARPRRADDDHERMSRSSRRRRGPSAAVRRFSGMLRQVAVEVAPGLRRPSLRRTSRATAFASTRATMASATTPAAGTAQTSERWWCASARLAGRHVDGAQRVRHGRDRLHAGTHPQHACRCSCRPRCRRPGR